MTTTTEVPRTVDDDLLGAFLGRLIGDVGSTVSAALVVIGDRLGLYRAMADGRPVTADELAGRTGTAVAYVRPWLANQAAGGYVRYDPVSRTFSMTAEQAYTLADQESPPSSRAACNWRSAYSATSPRSRTVSAPAPVSAGTS